MMLTKFDQPLSANGRLERRIVAALVAHLDKAGWVPVGVWDGESFEKAEDAKSAMEWIFNLDEASLRMARKVDIDARNAGGPKYHWHGILLVLGNGLDILADWNYADGDPDGFDATMSAFDPDRYA